MNLNLEMLKDLPFIAKMLGGDWEECSSASSHFQTGGVKHEIQWNSTGLPYKFLKDNNL